jgi:hypothetical protein
MILKPDAQPQAMDRLQCVVSRLLRADKIVFAGLTSFLLLTDAQAGTIEGINHTHWAINHFSVDGHSGIDIIGAYQGGGGGCCFIVPEIWHPEMNVQVEWETGVSGSKGFPGFSDWEKYLKWAAEADAQKRKHSKTASVPNYTGQNVCGITVHFLPCDDIQVTTSCHAYGSPEYPIKIPLHLPEPQSCPQARR